MNTAEMWLAAQIDGRTYRCPECRMLYSKGTELINDGDGYYAIYIDEFDFNDLMSCKWHVAEDVIIIKEAGKKLEVKTI